MDQACLESLHEAEQEAARMTRLVNDLLLLVQADAGEFLAFAPLRLDLLAREMGDQAQAMTDDQAVRCGPPARPGSGAMPTAYGKCSGIS